MTSFPSRTARLKAQNRVREAIAEYCEGEVLPAVREYDSGSVHLLSQQEVDNGVVALLLQCGVNHGSAGDVDLYRLVGAYLRDPEARREINEVLRGRGI